jgi:hypothetical protein
MDLSIFVAQVAAIIYLAVGVGILLDKKYYAKVFDTVMKDMTAMYLGGFMALIIGFALVTFHNEWVKSWEVLVTIIGWVALIKGVLLFAFPTTLIGLTKPFVNRKYLNVIAIVAIILGLVFGYFGFVA